MEVIYEEITFSLSTAGVPSKRDGSIPVVLIKEGISKNNRNYSRKILQDAIPLFEGAICYDGHSEGVRKPSEIFGRLRNVRTENEAMRGDLVPVREDGWFKQVRKIFSPSELGLSIHATGKIIPTEIDGKKVLDVREITGGPDNGKPRVDMVLFPAAGGALLESKADSWLEQTRQSILQEAEWTTEYINSLEDECFAVIEPAYFFNDKYKDDKRLRHLPHHNIGTTDGDPVSNLFLTKNPKYLNLDEHSLERLDMDKFKEAHAKANQLVPVTDSISTEDLRRIASLHLSHHDKQLQDKEQKESIEYGGNEMDLTQLTEQVKNLFGMQTQHATEVKGIKEILEKSIKIQEDTQKELQETKKLQVEWQSKAMLLEMLKTSKLSEASKQVLQENLKGEIDPKKITEAITRQEKLEEEILKGNAKNPVSQSGAKDNLPETEDKKAQLQKGIGALFESVMGNVSTATNQEGGQK